MGCGPPAAGSGGSGVRENDAACSPRSEARAEAAQAPRPSGRAGVTFLISAGISIVGEELSGPTRRRRGRRDASCLASVLQAR